jgi:hypothetical protein
MKIARQFISGFDDHEISLVPSGRQKIAGKEITSGKFPYQPSRLKKNTLIFLKKNEIILQ